MKSEVWVFRKWNFYIYTITFGIACIATGFGIAIEYLKHTSLLWFIPGLVAGSMTIRKFWIEAYKKGRE